MCLALQAVQDPVRPAERPIELSFQEGYGDIEQHLWFGEGYILIGFKTGVPSMAAGPTCFRWQQKQAEAQCVH